MPFAVFTSDALVTYLAAGDKIPSLSLLMDSCIIPSIYQRTSVYKQFYITNLSSYVDMKYELGYYMTALIR